MLILIELFIWTLLCTVFVTYESGYGAFWSTIIASVILWITGFNVFLWSWNNPKLLVTTIVIYAITGLIWCTFKFIVMLRKARNKYVKDKGEFVNSINKYAKNPNPRTEADWLDRVNNYLQKEDYAPTVKANKYKIMFWAWWWPFSIISFLCKDMITEIWNMTWNIIRTFFEGIRSSILGEAAKDLDKE